MKSEDKLIAIIAVCLTVFACVAAMSIAYMETHKPKTEQTK